MINQRDFLFMICLRIGNDASAVPTEMSPDRFKAWPRHAGHHGCHTTVGGSGSGCAGGTDLAIVADAVLLD